MGNSFYCSYSALRKFQKSLFLKMKLMTSIEMTSETTKTFTVRNSLCGRQSKACKQKMECNAYQTENMLCHSIRTKLWTFSFPVSDIYSPPSSILELSQRKVMLKRAGNYTTLRYTVQCPYSVLNFSQ